jgi:serine/threonine protein kinase
MSDPLTRLNTALEGCYRVEREFGEGGMATVGLAETLKHERQIAVKVLKPELAPVLGGERFLAEIKSAHPGDLTNDVSRASTPPAPYSCLRHERASDTRS